MRPVDFQTSLNQMGEVAKAEDLKRKLREEDKKKADAKGKVRLTEEKKTETADMSQDLVKASEPVQPDARGKKHPFLKQNEDKKTLPDKFKGNFLDISE